jgi:hypothetical protein
MSKGEGGKGRTMTRDTPMRAPATTMGHFRPILGTSIMPDAARVAVTPGRSTDKLRALDLGH